MFLGILKSERFFTRKSASPKGPPVTIFRFLQSGSLSIMPSVDGTWNTQLHLLVSALQFQDGERDRSFLLQEAGVLKVLAFGVVGLELVCWGVFCSY